MLSPHLSSAFYDEFNVKRKYLWKLKTNEAVKQRREQIRDVLSNNLSTWKCKYLEIFKV